MQTLNVVKQSNAKLKEKLANEEHTWKSADSALEGAQKQAENQRKLMREANDQLAASKEQLATLRKQLEEAQRLKDKVEKAKAEMEKAKAEAEKEKNEAEQHDYDVSVAKTKDTLRAEVPAVCWAYYAQTWEEALNQAGVDASSELRRSKNIFFPPAIRAPSLTPNQKEVAPPVAKLAEDAQLQNLPPPSQHESTKEPKALQGTSSDKAVEVPQVEEASQSFEQALALTTLAAGGTSKEKDKEVPPKTADKASKAKLQIKLKP